MGARRYTQMEIDELTSMFPLSESVPPFGTKLSKFCKKWNREEKNVRSYWNKMKRGDITTVQIPDQNNDIPHLTLDRLTDSLKELRDFLNCAVDELNKLIGD